MEYYGVCLKCNAFENCAKAQHTCVPTDTGKATIKMITTTDLLAQLVAIDSRNPQMDAQGPGEAAIAAALPVARLCLSEIDRLMEYHRYLTGDHVSLADLMAIPLLYYFSDAPDGMAPLAEHPKLQSWIRLMETRQSFQVTKPPTL